AVLAGAPAGADLALVRLDVGPAPLDADYIDRDFIAVINLTADPIDRVAMGIGDGDTVQLRQRGTLRRAIGGDSQELAALPGNGVWVTLASDAEARFELATPSRSQASAGVGPGEVIYLVNSACYPDCDDSGSLDFFDFL